MDEAYYVPSYLLFSYELHELLQFLGSIYKNGDAMTLFLRVELVVQIQGTDHLLAINEGTQHHEYGSYSVTCQGQAKHPTIRSSPVYNTSCNIFRHINHMYLTDLFTSFLFQ